MPPVSSGYGVDCPSSQLGNPQFPNPIAIGTTAVKILDPNLKRKEFIIQNTGTTILAIKFGAPANFNAGDFHVILSASSASRDGSGGTFISDMWQGSVYIVSNNVSGECVLTEEI